MPCAGGQCQCGRCKLQRLIDMQSTYTTANLLSRHAPKCVDASAQRIARGALRDAIHELCAVNGAHCAETLDRAAYELGRLVGHDLLDRAETADALTEACVVNGYRAEVGPDLVQSAISLGFRAGEAAASAEQTATGDETNEKDGDVDIKAWLIMESRASHGIVGKIARLATANSEADPVAVMATTLVHAACRIRSRTIHPRRRCHPPF